MTITPSAFKAVQEACAKVCEERAAMLRSAGDLAEDSHRSILRAKAASLAEAAAIIRSLTPSSIPGLTVAGESGWISVSDRLPVNMDDVLCMWGYVGDDDADQAVGYYNAESKQWSLHCGMTKDAHVTQWQPLPPPPALTTAPGKEER